MQTLQEPNYQKTNATLDKVYQEGRLEAFLYHYFSKLITEAKTAFILDPSQETFEMIIGKIKNISKYLNIKRNYRLV